MASAESSEPVPVVFDLAQRLVAGQLDAPWDRYPYRFARAGGGLRRPPLEEFPDATDGLWYASRLGAPTVMVFGPGRLADCHVGDERVEAAKPETWARIHLVAERSLIA